MIKTLKQGFLFSLLILVSHIAAAQDDLLSMLEEEQSEQTMLVEATFKGTRLINGHSIETRRKGVMDFIISHRFGTINGGIYELYGLDNANIRLGLEYAISDRMYIGAGRNSYQKTYDGFFKFKLLRQSTGNGAMPISATWLSSISIKTLKNPEISPSFVEKLAYTHQLLIARKMNASISIQLMPTWVHKNLILAEENQNNAFSLGLGGRAKLSQRVALVVEYYHQLQKINDDMFNPFAIGFDIETGGHVFQLQFTNATAMVPKGFITETRNEFLEGEVHFGFNISRTFQLK
jgi:hypothetical protein